MSAAVLDDIEEAIGALVSPPEEVSDVDHTTTYVACQFFGLMGGHNFYSGKPLYGIVNFLSFSFSFVSFCSGSPFLITAGTVNFIRQVISLQIDQYRIATGAFKDGKGKFIRQFTRIPKENVSPVDQSLTYFLSLFPLGLFGAHSLYAGGKLFWMARTLEMWILRKQGHRFGLLFQDQLRIATGSFKDSEGKIICPPYMQQQSVDLEVLTGSFKDSEGKTICPPYMQQQSLDLEVLDEELNTRLAEENIDVRGEGNLKA